MLGTDLFQQLETGYIRKVKVANHKVNPLTP
jgi:hypothetical protein